MEDMKLRGMGSSVVYGSYPTTCLQPDEEPVVRHWTCSRTDIVVVWYCRRGQSNGWSASTEAIVRGICNWSDLNLGTLWTLVSQLLTSHFLWPGLNLLTLVSQPLTSHFLWPGIRTIWSGSCVSCSALTVYLEVFGNCGTCRTFLIASRESLGSVTLALFRSLVTCDLFHNLVRALCCSAMCYRLFLSFSWLHAARSLKFTRCRSGYVFCASVVSLWPSISASNALVLLALLSSIYILANSLASAEDITEVSFILVKHPFWFSMSVTRPACCVSQIPPSLQAL